MTHRRPPPPRRQRYVWPLLAGAAFVGLCGLIGAAHPVVQADAAPVTVTPPTVSPSVAPQAPSRSAVRSLSPVTVSGPPRTVWRQRTAYLAGPTRTAWATTTATVTATTTTTATATVTATTTATQTATVTATQTVTAPAVPTQ